MRYICKDQQGVPYKKSTVGTISYRSRLIVINTLLRFNRLLSIFKMPAILSAESVFTCELVKSRVPKEMVVI